MTRTFALVAATLASVASAQFPAYRASKQAVQDPAASSLPGGVMLSIPGFFTDFTMAGGGQFVELPNGTARLTGRVFSDSSIFSALLLDIEFTGRLQSGNAGFPPAGGPSLGLLPSAYTPAGPVNPNAFTYYTAATGTLTGVRNLYGGVFTLQSSGPIQVGNGANNRNTGPGLLANFAITVVQQPPFTGTPTGTADLTIDFRSAPNVEDTTHPQIFESGLTNLVAGRAMTLPGVGSDYVFAPAGDFVENGNGTAQLTGKLVRLVDLTDAFDLTVNLSGRRDPGQAGHPPTNSPVQQMLPAAYVPTGYMNPSSWHYYTVATAQLVGAGINQGGVINLTQNRAFQVGGGANQTNTYMGFYARYAAAIASQPTGRTLAITGNVELFGMTAVFPVLPYPTLTAPTTMPTLPSLTDQGLVLQGDNLAWIELMALGNDLVGRGGPDNWYSGYFKVLSNTALEFHPRPGQAPGVYSCSGINPALPTNQIQVTLVAPTSPQLFADPNVPSFGTTHVLAHKGTAGPSLLLVTLSTSNLPSVAPGIVSLGIGDNFNSLVVDGPYLHDQTTGIAQVNYGPISPALGGMAIWFQGAIVDFGAASIFPMPATNAFRVQF